LDQLRIAKRPFNIHTVLRRIWREVKQFADAAMFDLARAVVALGNGVTEKPYKLLSASDLHWCIE